MNGPCSVGNTADVSVLLIDKTLEAAPDITIQNTVIDNYECIGPDENFKKEQAILKAVRDKTLGELETQLNKVIITEADDPPATGITFNLSKTVSDDVISNSKLKKNSKKKK